MKDCRYEFTSPFCVKSNRKLILGQWAKLKNNHQRPKETRTFFATKKFPNG